MLAIMPLINETQTDKYDSAKKCLQKVYELLHKIEEQK